MNKEVRNVLIFGGSLYAIYELSKLSFSHAIKERVREKQNNRCDLCGEEVEQMQVHHRVPENGLKRMGIRGKDVEENAVALCSGENGRGEGSPDDCHEIADCNAIHKRLFWNGSSFVPLECMPPETYVTFHQNERRTKKKRGRRK